MFKILVLGAILFVVYLVFFKKKTIEKKEKLEKDELVECSICNTFTIKDDMVIKNNKYICKDCLKN